MDIWKKLMNGDEVVVEDTSFGKTKRMLIFDKVSFTNDYGQNFTQIVFQKNKENLGRVDIPVIYHPKEFKIIEVNGVEIKEYEKSLKKKRKSAKQNSLKEFEVSDTDEPAKIHTKSGFEITVKNGRFYCPCGNSYSKRDNAIWNHKKHVVEK